MNSFINKTASGFFRKEAETIREKAENPQQTQEELLWKLLKKASRTAFGKKYGFTDFASYETYKTRVPVSPYEELEPYISRMIKGERDVLWPGLCTHFSKSSGTTNAASKYIPLTGDALYGCHIKGARGIVALYLSNNPDAKLFGGRNLRLGGSKTYFDGSPAVVGDLSAHLIDNTPFIINEFFSTPPKAVSLIADWNQKLPALLDEVAKADVRSLAGVPSWMLVMLNALLEKEGKSNLLEIWPKLELFLHGGINFLPYKERYQKLIPSQNMHYYENYNASEGYFAAQDRNGANDMLLLLDNGVFYEFVPLEEVGKPFPKAYPLWEVELDKVYSIIISTNAGLWRYAIGDTVRFTSVFPHRIKIAGRTKAFINAFGEELMVENAETALSRACEFHKAVIEEFTAAPVYMGDDKNGAHQWVVEFAVPPADFEAFAETLDAELQKLNSDYAAKRYSDTTLRRLILNPVPAKTFYRWMESRGKLGGQNKVPRLSNDRQYVEQLLVL